MKKNGQGGIQRDGSKNKKLMMMHKALHPRDDIDIPYISKEEEKKSLLPVTAISNRKVIKSRK